VAQRRRVADVDNGTHAVPGNGVLTERVPAESDEHSYSYDPLDPVPTGLTISRYPLYEDVPLDQTITERREDVVCFTSEPLEHEVVISGWPHLELFASSDCNDTDWHVKVTDVDPAGRSLRLSQGCLRRPVAIRSNSSSPNSGRHLSLLHRTLAHPSRSTAGPLDPSERDQQ